MRKTSGKLKRAVSAALTAILLISVFEGTAFAADTSLPADYKEAVHNYELRPYLMSNARRIKRGIDVSSYQGDIDWAKAAADPAGIDFAIIRAGNRSYGEQGELNTDAKFYANMSGVHDQELDAGVYFYSQAVTVEEAVGEAEYVLDLVERAGAQPGALKLPIFMDVEYAEGADGKPTGRLYEAKLSRQEQTDICNAFVRRIGEAGYRAGVYAQKSFLEDQMYAADLDETAAVWLAHYSRTDDYRANYMCWQFTDQGKIAGIEGAADLDFFYQSEENPDYRIAYAKRACWSREVLQTAGQDTVNLREHARTTDGSAVLCGIPKGAVLDHILGEMRTSEGRVWYKVRYGNYTGYISGEYTKPYTSAVTGLAADARTGSGMTLCWTRASCADGYEVQYSRSKDKDFQVLGTVYDQTACSLQISGLTAGTDYYFRIRAFRKEMQDGDELNYYGAYSEVYQASTTGKTPATAQTKKPSVPKGLAQKSAAKTAITLKWKKVSGADGYQIYRSTAKDGKYRKVKTISKAGTLTWKDTKKASGTEYYYKIRAYKKQDGSTVYSKFTSTAVMHTKAASRLKVKTKKKTVMRVSAGTSCRKKATIPKNKKFTVIYRTKDKAGKTWYKIKYKVKKKSYTGYIPAGNTKKI